ncbi:hypothetical protein DLAC_08009 [Tieghemostelium lacteum]|uniref:SH3 domain-containing protein n=1 Tax=Tieghemostelium lacteum TaxID=361077 RepID=A0A151ZAX6_TIELA|nr:hypothetical protein DLAC_08009 [Tieghemostelium lacteum]|eukprot:KYQ91103.1 hypothetical protein DLAC_08009 [Tieghemostelium lacteum]
MGDKEENGEYYDYEGGDGQQQEQEQEQQQQEEGGYFEIYWVRALYDYEAANDTEISFKENDVVCITADYNDGWWCGDINGDSGRVPANYFEYLNQDDQTQNQYYDETTTTYYDNTMTYDENGQTQYTEGGDWGGDTYNTVNQDPDNQFTDTYQQETTENVDIHDQQAADEKKEQLRLKREQFKREMKDLQDNLKKQNEAKDTLGLEIDSLEKQRDQLEDEIRIYRLLKFIQLEITKLEVDNDLDTDITTQSRQAGITVTQDLKSLRTLLNPAVATGKPTTNSSQILDPVRKQFDLKLEEIEKKFTNNLNNLDICDNLKKILVLSLTQFQSQFSATTVQSPTSPTLSSPPPSLTVPPPLTVPILNQTTQQQAQQLPQNLPPPPPSGFVVATPSVNHPYYSSPIVSPGSPTTSPPQTSASAHLQQQAHMSTTLSEKDKKKVLKEAKKIEKQEKKEEKKLEKLEKKERKKGESEDTPLWKSNPTSTSPSNSKK